MKNLIRLLIAVAAFAAAPGNSQTALMGYYEVWEHSIPTPGPDGNRCRTEIVLINSHEIRSIGGSDMSLPVYVLFFNDAESLLTCTNVKLTADDMEIIDVGKVLKNSNVKVSRGVFKCVTDPRQSPYLHGYVSKKYYSNLQLTDVVEYPITACPTRYDLVQIKRQCAGQ